ncbi:hypothetical protein P7C73_g2000, partial [Tremellales sp. Uapishka_1]
MPAAPKTNYKQPKAETSASASQYPKRRPTEKRNPDGLPGLSKIKASIRQTKRLLAKESLEPSLRVSTQRRLTALEADLAQASKREVEKKNGAKYHMVKFYEKQKLLRLIRRLQKDGDGAEKDLEAARIMLNYVLHYPNTEKYIALFPSEKDDTKDAGSSKLTLPPILSASAPAPETLDKPLKKRLDMLESTRMLMTSGQLSKTPDEGLGEGKERQHVSIESGAGGAKGKKVEKKDEAEEDEFFDVDD